MSALDTGSVPEKLVRAAVAPLLITALSLLQTGCASNGNAHYAQAPAVAAYVAQAKVEIEDDGLPTQPPPTMRIRQMPDDPSEPYSRNYGGPNPAAVEAAPEKPRQPVRTVTAAIPTDLPPAFRRQLVAAVEVERAD